MAKTTKIELIYTLTQKETIPPPLREMERKDAFMKACHAGVKSDWQPVQVKVTYQLFNPEVEQLRRFFHTCVKYFAIQNEDMVDQQPDYKLLEKYREELLDELIGYDYQTVNKVIRKRPSTETYKETQPWLTLLESLKETIFESHGFDFPVSEDFWAMVKEMGYDRAQAAAIKQLQAKMKRNKSV